MLHSNTLTCSQQIEHVIIKEQVNSFLTSSVQVQIFQGLLVHSLKQNVEKEASQFSFNQTFKFKKYVQAYLGQQ